MAKKSKGGLIPIRVIKGNEAAEALKQMFLMFKLIEADMRKDRKNGT